MIRLAPRVIALLLVVCSRHRIRAARPVQDRDSRRRGLGQRHPANDRRGPARRSARSQQQPGVGHRRHVRGAGRQGRGIPGRRGDDDRCDQRGGTSGGRRLHAAHSRRGEHQRRSGDSRTGRHRGDYPGERHDGGGSSRRCRRRWCGMAVRDQAPVPEAERPVAVVDLSVDHDWHRRRCRGCGCRRRDTSDWRQWRLLHGNICAPRQLFVRHLHATSALLGNARSRHRRARLKWIGDGDRSALRAPAKRPRRRTCPGGIPAGNNWGMPDAPVTRHRVGADLRGIRHRPGRATTAAPIARNYRFSGVLSGTTITGTFELTLGPARWRIPRCQSEELIRDDVRSEIRTSPRIRCGACPPRSLRRAWSRRCPAAVRRPLAGSRPSAGLAARPARSNGVPAGSAPAACVRRRAIARAR